MIILIYNTYVYVYYTNSNYISTSYYFNINTTIHMCNHKYKKVYMCIRLHFKLQLNSNISSTVKLKLINSDAGIARSTQHLNDPTTSGMLRRSASDCSRFKSSSHLIQT